MSFFTHHTWMSLYYTSHSTHFTDHLICTKITGQCWGALSTVEFQPSSWQAAAGTPLGAQTLEIRQAWMWILALPFTCCDCSQDRQLSEPHSSFARQGWWGRKRWSLCCLISGLLMYKICQCNTQYDLINVTFSPVHLPVAKELHISPVRENVL